MYRSAQLPEKPPVLTAPAAQDGGGPDAEGAGGGPDRVVRGRASPRAPPDEAGEGRDLLDSLSVVVASVISTPPTTPCLALRLDGSAATGVVAAACASSALAPSAIYSEHQRIAAHSARRDHHSRVGAQVRGRRLWPRRRPGARHPPPPHRRAAAPAALRGGVLGGRRRPAAAAPLVILLFFLFFSPSPWRGQIRRGPRRGRRVSRPPPVFLLAPPPRTSRRRRRRRRRFSRREPRKRTASFSTPCRRTRQRARRRRHRPGLAPPRSRETDPQRRQRRRGGGGRSGDAIPGLDARVGVGVGVGAGVKLGDIDLDGLGGAGVRVVPAAARTAASAGTASGRSADCSRRARRWWCAGACPPGSGAGSAH